MSDRLHDAVERSIKRNKWNAIDDWLMEGAGEPFTDETLSVFVEYLQQERFLKSTGSYHLLVILEYEWERFSETQKEVLLPYLESSYPRFDDWMSCFVIAELLGRFYANESAYRVLSRLRKTPNDAARSLVPMGLRYIATESSIPSLSAQAYNDLLSMRQDSSPMVIDEVEMALQALKNKQVD